MRVGPVEYTNSKRVFRKLTDLFAASQAGAGLGHASGEALLVDFLNDSKSKQKSERALV
jgi:hypothetical protein